jgi:hypothetical protein
VVAATTGPTAAVVVDYIGIALQFSAFVIVLAALAVFALVMPDSPSPSPPVRAGVFVVLSPALLPQPPATDLTAWIYSAIAIGVSFFVLCVRRFSFFVRGIDCVAFFVVYTREPRATRRRRGPPAIWTPELGPCRVVGSDGPCGLEHLHAHCPIRTANRATAAAEKAKAKRANDALISSCPDPGPSPVSCKPPLDYDPNFDYEGACYELFEAADLAARSEADCTGCPDCMADESYHWIHRAMDEDMHTYE